MATQSILWTALPNGVDEEGNLRVSVLVSPRLDAQNQAQRLDTFADFIDWPQTVRDSKFSLRFGTDELTLAGSDFTGSSRVDDRIGLASSQVWAALLPAQTHVDGFSFGDMTSATILSYPISKIADRQRRLYTTLARRNDDELPELVELQNDPDWKDFIRDIGMIDRQYQEDPSGMPRNVNQQFAALKAGKVFPGLSAAQQEQVLFQLFHTPPSTPQVQNYDGISVAIEKQKTSWQTYGKTPLPTASELVARYDFHQIVAAMNQYPSLLRLMGLVVDFVIEPEIFLPAADNLLSVSATLPASNDVTVTRMTDASPPVHSELSDAGFALVASPPGTHKVSIRRGLLDITYEHFDLIQHDVDGTGIKTTNMARSLMLQSAPRRRIDPTTRLERKSGIPALRNAGLALIQREREDDLGQRFNNSQLLNAVIENHFVSGTPGAIAGAGLHAEDLVRGYRYDIWDDATGLWHSLCQRQADYKVAGLPDLHIANEEGTSRLAATHSADPANNTDVLYLHEILVAWTGWSLCAPMPGRIIAPDDQLADQQGEVPPGMPLQSVFRVVPGSLPRLRYGRRYWIRARAVDLAGNSLPPFDGDLGKENPQDQAQAYLRYDPLRAPTIALCRDGDQLEIPLEGESMLRMAIRTFNATPDLNLIDTSAVTHRAVLAERSSVKDAELHGSLDAAGLVNAGMFALLAGKDSDLQTVAVDSIPQPLAPDGVPVSSTDYAVHDTGTALPYLPDPVCLELAARLFDHPTISDQVIIPIPLYAQNGKWPDAQPLRVRLYESTSAIPVFDAAQRVLHVPLPKAYRARLRLSVKPDKETLNLLGIWHWLSNKERGLLEQRALNGQHWMLTPWREVELVHAVQKPLISPDAEVRVFRQVNKTWAIPMLTAPVSLKSTEQVDLLANWHEPAIDDNHVPIDNPRHDHAFTVKISEPGKYLGKPDHRILKPDLIRAGSKGADLAADKVHEFNDTRYRRIQYWLEASSKFREYMPASILTELDDDNKKQLTDQHIKISGLPVRTWIPSSAPPPTPRVSYLMPTYQWIRSNDAGKTHSWRRSGGFRVYLEGPWYASGYGEMLAVILPGDAMQNLDPNTLPGSQPLKNLVTQWGNDPIWKSPFLAGTSPRLSDFPLARTTADPDGDWLPAHVPADESDQPPEPFKTGNLPHPQIRNARSTSATEKARKLVNIAPHDVGYDGQRKLWYCDIDLAPKTSYYPFIRLALARYQPVSVNDCHLSNIVLADFMTLPNDRHVSISHGPDPLKHTVQVSGRSYTDSSGHKESQTAPQSSLVLPDGSIKIIKAADVSETSIVDVWVEKNIPALGEDFGWEKDTAAKVQQASDSDISPQPGLATGVATASMADTFSPARRQAEANRTQVRRRAAISQPQLVNEPGLLNEALAELFMTMPSLWLGTVVLPAGAANDGIRRRLVVAEYEEYFVDDSSPYDSIPTSKDRRLVYVDHVELS